MDKRIIHPNGNGGISIITPAPCDLTIDEIAKKDTPDGVPYRIINSSDIPDDRSTRDAWEADFSKPDGYGVGPEAWLAANPPKAAQ